MKGYSMNIG